MQCPKRSVAHETYASSGGHADTADEGAARS